MLMTLTVVMVVVMVRSSSFLCSHCLRPLVYVLRSPKSQNHGPLPKAVVGEFLELVKAKGRRSPTRSQALNP